LYLAFTGPVLLAPAMNVNMWRHAATRENVETLGRRGNRVIEPGTGYLACGMTGAGRMAEPEEIAGAIEREARKRRDLEGETVLITAGPTQEPLDPVRYISNRSSGKMGYAMAEAAAGRGARVVLISGPVHLAPPPGVEVAHVRTAAEMRERVFENLEPASIVIKAAAVADFHLSHVPDQKRKKSAARLSLELDPTPDILAELGRKKGDRLLVGFAAETENLRQEARRKLESKNCDMVVGNLVGGADLGFESDENEVVLALSTGETLDVGRASKRDIAERIFDEILKLRLALHAAHES
jgi:phosphopantothenoylcysteine decarboxylase/phosphopantothenate--cysteine ligase